MRSGNTLQSLGFIQITIFGFGWHNNNNNNNNNIAMNLDLDLDDKTSKIPAKEDNKAFSQLVNHEDVN